MTLVWKVLDDTVIGPYGNPIEGTGETPTLALEKLQEAVAWELTLSTERQDRLEHSVSRYCSDHSDADIDATPCERMRDHGEQ